MQFCGALISTNQKRLLIVILLCLVISKQSKQNLEEIFFLENVGIVTFALYMLLFYI